MSEKSSSAKSARAPARHQATKYLVLAALSALAAFAAVYVIAGRPDNDRGAAPASQTQAAKPQTGAGINPLSTGAMTTFVFKKEPQALPDIAFVDGAGKPVRLADWRGKVVLLNLWATWCAPCREEMPALDKLQAELGSGQIPGGGAGRGQGRHRRREEVPRRDQGQGPRRVRRPDRARRHRAARDRHADDDPHRRRRPRDRAAVGPAAWDSAEARRLVEGVLSLAARSGRS